MTTPEEQAAIELEKIFWLISEDEYSKLRKINGCEDLTDLPATIPDNKHALKMADYLGIPEDNRYLNISPDVKELKSTYLKIINKSRDWTRDGIPHVLFCYVGGHGATKEEKQLFLLNTEDPKKAIWQIEFKLRYLALDMSSLARVFGVYNCCRAHLNGYAGLAGGRGAG